MTNSCLILIAHGSKDPRWRMPFEKLEKALRIDLGGKNVYLSYMEFASPAFQEAVKNAVSNGAEKIKALPLFMAGGAHVDADIPPMVARARQEFPDVKIELLPPIGEHPKFEKLIYQIAIDSA